MFLTEEDYIVASNAALNVLQQCSEEKRETAERMAIEEVSGYLRSRYDVKKIFAATGSERNNIIVLRTRTWPCTIFPRGCLTRWGTK